MKSAVATTQGKYLFTVETTGAGLVLLAGADIGVGGARLAGKNERGSKGECEYYALGPFRWEP
jgi:hypothetical protein